MFVNFLDRVYSASTAPALLALVRAAHPEITVSLVEVSPSEQEEIVAAGDVYALRGASHAGLAVTDGEARYACWIEDAGITIPPGDLRRVRIVTVNESDGDDGGYVTVGVLVAHDTGCEIGRTRVLPGGEHVSAFREARRALVAPADQLVDEFGRAICGFPTCDAPANGDDGLCSHHRSGDDLLGSPAPWRIRRLREEAGVFGDLEQVLLCDRALQGSRRASDEVARVLDRAEAQIERGAGHER